MLDLELPAMAVKNSRSLEQFQADAASTPAAVAYFWATWCEPCQQMDVVFSQLASEIPDQNFLRVEAEEVADVSEKYGVSSVPYFIFFQNGAVVDTLEGANPPELAHKVTRHVASKSTSRSLDGPSPSSSGASAAPAVLESVLTNARTHGHPHETSNGATSLNDRLKALVNSKPLMLFIKGTPDNPRCGFSSKVVDVIKSLNVDFNYFDILTDEEVRQGMKEYGNWPTFPQVYHNGELVGGCDIVLELHRSGELQKMLENEIASSKNDQGTNSLNDRLSKLIRTSKTMLFMKGTPEEPRCGFSRKVVAALKESGIPFGSFDILEDEEVRQGLKTYSNWPTYPQLYHDGELVGGCDIVLELQSTGELVQTLS